jgi:type I restriction enzyme S subunit
MVDAVRAKTLGDYVDLRRGNTYKSALLGLAGPVLLGLASIARNGGFRSDNLKTYGGPSDKRMLLIPGEIYVSLKDVTQSADLLGAVARVPETIPLGRLTQDTVKLVFKEDDAPRGYIYWLLRTPQYRGYCRAHATGTTNLGLPREDFLAFEVPELNQEREMLLALLQALDDKIEVNRRMNETLEAVARAIFKDWFVDFGPTRAKAEGRAPYLAPEIWDLFPDALDDEGKPVGWTMRKAAELFEFNPRETIRKGTDAPYLDMAALPTTGPVPDPPTRRDYNSGTKFRAGYTLFARITPFLENGKTAYVFGLGDDVVGAGSTEFIVIRSKDQVPAPISYLLARDHEFRRHAERSMTGTSGRQRANADALMRFELASPLDDALWRALGRLIEPMIARVVANAHEARTLAQTRDLLLPKLMSGEITPRDAEKTVEAAA